MLNKLSSPTLTKSNQGGFTLLEALIAMGVMVAGTAAVFGIHSFVAGNSADARITTAALGLAQDRIEEFRNIEFENIPTTGDDLRSFTIPTLAGDGAVELKRCWSSQVINSVGGISNLLEVSVNVVRSNENCDAQSLASLTTLIARQDPRIAANVSLDQGGGDGEGLKYDYDVEGKEHNPNDGFIVDKDTDGNITTVYNPQTGKALTARGDNTPFRHSTISGNIFYYNIDPLAADTTDITDTTDTTDTTDPLKLILNRLSVRAEGVATCQVFFPDKDTTTSLPSFNAADGKKVSIIQYSCVVANNWRRAIFLIPKNDERVCVGSPSEMAINELSINGKDINQHAGRTYIGYKTEDGQRVPVGVRGSSKELGSAFGSVCQVGDDCWDNTNINGLVSGGHHFFITPFNPASTTNPSCTTVLKSIYIDSDDKKINEFNFISRNPASVQCVNDPKYTDSIGAPVFDPITNLSIPTNDCYSFTRVSGFINKMNNDVTSFTPNIKSTPNVGCDIYMPDGTSVGLSNGGTYHCDFVDLDLANDREVEIVARGYFGKADNPTGQNEYIFNAEIIYPNPNDTTITPQSINMQDHINTNIVIRNAPN